MPATTRQEVEAQSTKDRLWESLDNKYGLKREDIANSYNQAYSQADRQLLSRGMQRSSYGAQTLANIGEQAIKARANNWSEQIAEYQDRLTEQEQQDWVREFQERQFAEGVRQFDQGNANNLVMNILASGQMPSDDALAQAGISKADAELMRSYYAQQIAAAKSSGSRAGSPKPTTNPGDTGDDKDDKGTTPDYAKLMKTLDFAGLNALRTDRTASLRGAIDAQKDIQSGTANTTSGAHAILKGGLNARTSTLALDRKKK